MLAGIGIRASREQMDQFRAHFELLLRWNSRMNLTAIREPREILRRHFVESAFLTRVLRLGKGTLVDVGSGAGFPGIPVKVLSPETRVVLVEATQKKAAFLKEVARELGVGGWRLGDGLEVMAARVEETDLRADWLTMRAVKLTPQLLKALARVLVPRGTLALFVGKGEVMEVLENKQFIGINWCIERIPNSESRVILIGEGSTWNTVV